MLQKRVLRKSHFASCALRLVLLLVSLTALPVISHAHFSYSDPRIIHLAEQDSDQSILLVRMPAPLGLLPDDWEGADDPREPPFSVVKDGQAYFDLESDVSAIRNHLDGMLTVWSGEKRLETSIMNVRFWSDSSRPGFGTLKSALAAFDVPADNSEVLQSSYFDLTVDVMMSVRITSLSQQVRLESQLGQRFRVMDKLGTIVKLHRNDTTDTMASMGVLDVSFPEIAEKRDIYLGAAWTGAEHIYRGLDHLAMIVLIAIAATSWRKALVWASAFTIGHMVTLAAGLYGFMPLSAAFVPMVELAIALSIVATGVAVFLRRSELLGWISVLSIGMIHGFGFAASASEVLFAGPFDSAVLVAFAVGLEICQFLIYGLVLLLILQFDRTSLLKHVNWRRAGAIGIAASASFAVIARLSEATNAFWVI